MMLIMTTDLWELLHNVVDLRRTKPYTTRIQSAVTPWDDFSHGIGFHTYMRGLGVCQLQLAIIVGIDKRK